MKLKSVLGVVLVAGSLLLASACIPVPVLWPAPAAPAPTDGYTIPAYVGSGPTVGVLGDSITSTTWGNGVDLPPALEAAGYGQSVTGNSGSTAVGARPYEQLYKATTPRVMVFELGTNDAIAIYKNVANQTVDLFRQRMTTFVADFPTSCVVVVTAPTNQDSWRAVGDQVNAVLRSLSGVEIADWQVVAAAHPEYLPDGIHPYGSKAGRAALTDVELQAVSTCGVLGT